MGFERGYVEVEMEVVRVVLADAVDVLRDEVVVEVLMEVVLVIVGVVTVVEVNVILDPEAVVVVVRLVDVPSTL